MRYLITGCSGFIGSNLAFRLSALGEDVWGIDSLDHVYDIGLRKDSVQRFQDRDIAFSRLDLATDGLNLLCDEWDFVIHCAGIPPYISRFRPQDYVSNNVRATQRLIAALATTESKTKLIYLSSSSAVGLSVVDDESVELNPISEYGKSKRTAEAEIWKAAAEELISASVLRLFSVYGDRERSDKLFPQLVAANRWNREFNVPAGSIDHVRDFVHVDDVCGAVLKVIGNWDKAEGEVFHIGTGRETLVGDAIELACQTLEVRPIMKGVASRPDSQIYAVAQIRKAETLLGWRPSVSLEDGLLRFKRFADQRWY